MRPGLAATIVSLFAVAVTMPEAVGAQDCTARPERMLRNAEPPGRNVFIPFVSRPGAPVEEQVRAVAQLRMLAEMNRLTVELVKRRSDPHIHRADTPQLVKRLKRLAKELAETD